MLHVHMACILWVVDLIPLFHGFHASRVYPKVPECVDCVYSKHKKSVYRVLVVLRTISTSGRSPTLGVEKGNGRDSISRVGTRKQHHDCV